MGRWRLRRGLCFWQEGDASGGGATPRASLRFREAWEPDEKCEAWSSPAAWPLRASLCWRGGGGSEVTAGGRKRPEDRMGT